MSWKASRRLDVQHMPSHVVFSSASPPTLTLLPDQVQALARVGKPWRYRGRPQNLRAHLSKQLSFL